MRRSTLMAESALAAKQRVVFLSIAAMAAFSSLARPAMRAAE